MLSGRKSTRNNLCTRPHSDSSPWACPLKVLFGVAKLLAVCCLLLVVPYLLPVSCALSSICSVWPIFYLLAWRAVGSNLPRTRHAAHELMGMTRIPPPCQQPRKDSAWARAASLPGWMEVLPPGRRARGSRRAVGRWQHARGAQSARRTRSRAARQVVRWAGAGRRAAVQAAHARGAAGALGTLRFVPPFRAAFPPARPSPPPRTHARTDTHSTWLLFFTGDASAQAEGAAVSCLLLPNNKPLFVPLLLHAGRGGQRKEQDRQPKEQDRQDGGGRVSDGGDVWRLRCRTFAPLLSRSQLSGRRSILSHTTTPDPQRQDEQSDSEGGWRDGGKEGRREEAGDLLAHDAPFWSAPAPPASASPVCARVP